jgi:putative acetyltransferase
MGTLQLPFPSETLWKKRLATEDEHLHKLAAILDGKVVGLVSLHREVSARRAHVASIGLSVHPDVQRRGIGSALLKAIMDLAFKWLQVKRIELDCFADNEAAIALYKKHGFEIEGTKRQGAFRNGKFVDLLFMATLSAE